MVAPINSLQNGTVDTTTHSISASTSHGAISFKMLPQGKYTLVGIDIDTTGRRLIDEIVQLAAYTPKDHFEQYIMPYMNLNPAARQRHQVRVISIGFYRMLKSMQTYKIIKSKSEIAALKDFLDWLEAVKAKDINSKGCILVYHEERKFIPYMILESLKKYNLLDRFLNTVKSFANGLNLVKSNPNGAFQHYSLRKLLNMLTSNTNEMGNNNQQQNVATSSEQLVMYSMTSNLSPLIGRNLSLSQQIIQQPLSQQQIMQQPLPQQQIMQQPLSQQQIRQQPLSQQKSQQSQQDRELFDGNASVRAKLVFDVGLQLSNQDGKIQGSDSPGAIEKFLGAIYPHAQPIDFDLNELQTQNENLERQNSFRPVFLNYFKTTLYHRVRAVKFRIILAEQGYDLATLNAIWSEKLKDGIIEVLQVIEELKLDDKIELADLFDSYFDPNKTTIKPTIKNNNRRRNRRGVRNGNNSKSDGGNHNNNGPYSSSSAAGKEKGAGDDKQVSAAAAQPQQLPDSTTKSPNQPTNAFNNNNGNMGSKPPRGNKRNPRPRNNLLKTEAPTASAPRGGAGGVANYNIETQQQPPMIVTVVGQATSNM